jgi:hypothetical protein
MYFPRALAVALAVILAGSQTAASALAQEKPGRPAAAGAALATVKQFVDGLNKGDMEAALATCAPRTSIIDEFPPHEWQGATACQDWARDFAAANKSAGISGGVVTLGTLWRIDVNGSRAYLVTPASFSYKAHGKPVTEKNSIFTVALQRLGGNWRITGWAWAAH